MNQYRQGDVMLVKIEELPASAKAELSSDNNIVLAYGESTGHAHRINSGSATLYTFGNDRFLEVSQPTDLVHEEHSAMKIAQGIYKVVRQREYSPENIRTVVD